MKIVLTLRVKSGSRHAATVSAMMEPTVPALAGVGPRGNA
jgi:hypothetical protein